MQRYMDRVRSSILFGGFIDTEIYQALNCLQGTVKDFSKKEVIFREEDLLDEVGIILYGHILLCKENIAGMRFIFSELGDGELVGETALSHTRESCGYEAISGSDSRVLFIKINKIVRPNQETCHLRGRIIENMLALLLEKNRSIYQKLDLVSHKSLRDRILHYLHLQAKKNNSSVFSIPFTRGELADYLTVDRSALSRELQRMARDGLIHFSKNQFELLPSDHLLKMNGF